MPSNHVVSLLSPVPDLLKSMELLRGPMPVCPANKRCLEWAHKYLKDCVCDVKDEISFALGLISVFCWGVAEVPQIITNFKEKCTEGISLAFLMTWVVGDLFNLAGCYLEPSTLPTQFYMALLYTITTLILVAQVLYYDHICKWRRQKTGSEKDDFQEQLKVDTATQPLLKALEGSNAVNGQQPKQILKITENSDAAAALDAPIPSKPIPATASPQIRHSGRGFYYTSARSLASSHTPTAGSYLVGSRGYGSRDTSSPLQGQPSLDEANRATSLLTANSAPVFRAVASAALCICGLSFDSYLGTTHILDGFYHQSKSKAFLVQGGRKLLQANHFGHEGGLVKLLAEGGEIGGVIGVYLGWLMAAIYMGGRLPQIWLNIKRGSVEGLNPLMFMFALLGNITYVGSILVRSVKWEKIKSNMPWLVDAGVCVLLDFLIICQFIYYYTRKEPMENEDSGDYEPLK